MADHSKKQSRRFSIIFDGGFCAIGFGLILSSLLIARQSIRAANWPTTPATILQIELTEGETYAVEVDYQYTVKGISYVGTRLAFGYKGDSNREAHDEIFRKLKAAKTVAARYNPADPSESCLSYGLPRSVIFQFIFGVIWLGFCIGFTLDHVLPPGDDSILAKNLSVE